MNRSLTIALGLLLLFGACANNESASPEESAVPLESVSQESATAPAANTAMSKSDAERLAQKHLAIKQVSWGKPSEVVEEDEKYLVHYETPKRELRLIGQRTLIVEKESGLVSYQKRR
jgi:hypothetical protein